MSAIVKCDVVFLRDHFGVYAVFPGQPRGVCSPNLVTAFDAIGGHFEATADICYEDEKAEDYTDLYNKMVSIGYELNIVGKETLVNNDYRQRRISAFKVINSV